MLVALLLALQAAPMKAPAAPCSAPAPLPADLAGWAKMRSVTAATIATRLGPAALAIGTGARVTLAPAASVRYAVAPEKPGVADTYGGILGFRVNAAGRYRVALGAGAWIDVIGRGVAAKSVAHGHGPACTPVRKMVDFDLTPGAYQLQVSGNATPTLAVLVAPVAK